MTDTMLDGGVRKDLLGKVLTPVARREAAACGRLQDQRAAGVPLLGVIAAACATKLRGPTTACYAGGSGPGPGAMPAQLSPAPRTETRVPHGQL